LFEKWFVWGRYTAWAAAIFAAMNRISSTFIVTSFALTLLWCLAGCGTAEGFQPEDGVALEPVGDSGVDGSVAFQGIEGGVEVELEVRGLPEPETIYLSHVHLGACGDEHEGHDEDEGHHDHQGHGDEIEYPLSPVKSDTEGNGASTTTLWDTSVEELFSGDPKHVNVHAAGPGMQRPLACADLSE
jgi:hypothetical protein